MTELADRLAAVRARLGPGVTLVAVSKLQPPTAIREAYRAGQRDFGENYAQEWRDKARQLADLPGLVWHFIGGLQTNKVKYLAPASRHGAAAAPAVGWVHTVDRLELAEELSRRSTARGGTMRVLVEVNVGHEASKSGCRPADLAPLAERMLRLPGLELRGLMCIPPAEGDPRPHFARLRELRDGLGLALPDLSMGMSGDYAIAIEEGATLVRVGTAIFGERPRRDG
jgi:pyridoxal phosphate enzyme (YggS family)